MRLQRISDATSGGSGRGLTCPALNPDLAEIFASPETAEGLETPTLAAGFNEFPVNNQATGPASSPGIKRREARRCVWIAHRPGPIHTGGKRHADRVGTVRRCRSGNPSTGRRNPGPRPHRCRYRIRPGRLPSCSCRAGRHRVRQHQPGGASLEPAAADADRRTDIENEAGIGQEGRAGDIEFERGVDVSVGVETDAGDIDDDAVGEIELLVMFLNCLTSGLMVSSSRISLRHRWRWSRHRLRSVSGFQGQAGTSVRPVSLPVGECIGRSAPDGVTGPRRAPWSHGLFSARS